jgi:hypothetical protein
MLLRTKTPESSHSPLPPPPPPPSLQELPLLWVLQTVALLCATPVRLGPSGPPMVGLHSRAPRTGSRLGRALPHSSHATRPPRPAPLLSPRAPRACEQGPRFTLHLRASTCLRGLRPLHPTTSGHVTWRLGSGPTGLRAGAPPHPGTRPASLIHVHARRGSLPTACAPVLPDTGPAGFVARDLPPTQLWTCP